LPPLQSASVPVCSTELVPSPSSPTQKLEKVSVAVQVTAGWDQDADTLVNVPALPADAYPAQFWLVVAALAALTTEPCPAEPGIIVWPP